MTTADWPGLAAAIAAAGLVYGFAGFGAALVFVPVAARLTSPAEAAGLMAVGAAGSVVTVLPDALRTADRRAAGTILAAALVAMPFGVWVLRTTDADLLRWVVSAVVLVTLAALLAGWRLPTAPGVPAWLAVGAGVGFSGGATGLNGPPMILFQLAGPGGAALARANTITVLTLTSLLLLPLLLVQGAVGPEVLWMGLTLIPVYALGTWLGKRLFDPAREALYRRTAYAVVAASALVGLPVW